MKIKLRNLKDKPECIFLIIGSIFGILSMFMMPILTIPDEGAHFWRSYRMTSSNEKLPNDLLVSAENSVQKINNGTYFNDLFKKKANLEGDSFKVSYKKTTRVGSSTRTSKVIDVSRTPQAIGILIGRLIYPSIGVMVIFGRITNLALYLMVIYFIIKKVKFGKLAFLFLALFPMLIHQAGSLSYDVMNIVAIFTWIALMINLFTQETTISKKQLALLSLLTIVFLLTKQSNLLLLGFLPFIPKIVYVNTRPFQTILKIAPFKINKKIFKITLACLLGAIFTASLFFAYKYIHTRGIGTSQLLNVLFNTFFRPEVNPQLDPIITTGIVGNFGWLWYRLPEWLVFIHLSMFGIILLGEKKSLIVSKCFSFVSLSLFILSIIGITLGMYFQWTLLPGVAGINAKFIQGMQGRYFTPLLALLIPTFMYLRQYISIKIDQKLLVKLTVFMAIFTLVTYLVLTYIFFYTPADGVKNILL